MQWQADWGLRMRMGATMLLLGALYLVFAGALTLYFPNLFYVACAMVGLSFVQLLYSDRLALRSMGARTVSESEYPELHRSVGRLAQQADLPKPAVAVSDSEVPNAFATGRSQRAATVTVTTGLVETLDQSELEGVIAHELAHIKNRDVMVMTVASFFSSLAFLFVRWGWLFGGSNRRGGGVGVAILVSLVVWVLSFVLIRTLSRYREFAADRGGAVITGQPSALASALLKIDGGMDEVPTEDLRQQAEMNAFFIVPITQGFIGKLARTHPPTEQRVDRLRELEHELERR